MKLYLIIIVTFFSASSLGAQEMNTPKTNPENAEQRIEFLKQFDIKKDDKVEVSIIPEGPPAWLDNPEVKSKYETSLIAYYDYRISGYDHRAHLFEWQFLSSKIIFVIVIGLVLSGVYFAAIQFHAALNANKLSPTETDQTTTEFVFSFKEFKIRSPVLGVIILTISLAFFYLYLIYVYPINNVL